MDDGLEADERLAAPILGDEREQAMLDPVPLAGSGRQVTDRDGDAELVSESLQLALPQTDTHPVAAAAIGGDQQLRRMRVARTTHRLPPAPNGIDREARRVIVDADAHPSGIVGDVVSSAASRLAMSFFDFCWVVIGMSPDAQYVT